MATSRAVESPEKNAARLAVEKQRNATSIAVESPEKNAARLLADKQRHAEGKNINNISLFIAHDFNSIYMIVL